MKIFLIFFFSWCCIHFNRRLGIVNWFITSHSFDAEVFHKCRFLIHFIRQNQRDSMCFEFLTMKGSALDSCCSTKQHYFLALSPSLCVFSVQYFAEHHTAFTSRYSSNCTFRVTHPGLMWFAVMIPDYDGSISTSRHHPLVKHSFSWRELCHPLPVVCYCPLWLSTTCWCPDCQRLIVWFWKASSLVNA